MNGFLKRKQKRIRIVAGVLIYCMAVFPVLTSTGWSAPAPGQETVEMSAREKQDLVQQGVEQYKQGKHNQAQKNLEQARTVFPENYAAPYYLGLIYLKQGKRSAAITQWRQYIQMDPKGENALRIRKNLTLLLREEARDSARLAVANEAALINSPAAENTVAISAFNNLGSDNIQPLGKGMAALLIHDISRFPELQVVERIRLQALLKEMKLGTSGLVAADTAPRVGKLLKAKHVTSGSLADLEKESLQIASALVDADKSARVQNQEAQGQLKKFYELEKDIACQIVEDLGRSCDDAPPAFYKTHTKSLAALTAYSVGLNYFDEENYDQARASFQSAVEQDPSFELAQEALLATPVPAMQYGGTGMGTTAEMIAMADAYGVPADAAGTATVAGSGGSAGGVGILPVVGIIGGVGAVAGIAANSGGSSGGGTSSANDNSPSQPTPSPYEDWRSWTDPEAPSPFQDATVWVDVNVEGVTAAYAVSGYPNGYRDSGSGVSASDGTISFRIPGDEFDLITYTVTVSVPEWGTSYVRDFVYNFQ
jgi:Tfp pilus assembly protein PilF